MARSKKQTPPNQLFNIRVDARLSVKDVAFLLNIKNAGRISEWEHGTSCPGIEHLFALAIIYKTIPDQLYYELRQTLVRKIEERRKLLQELKGDGVDLGG